MRGYKAGTIALTAGLPLLLVLLVGCDDPLTLPFTQVERPDYNNPVDPESRVLISEILSLVPDTNFRNVIQQAAERQGAIYNTELQDLWVDLSALSVASIDGIQYLPELTSFGIGPGGGLVFDFSPLAGHTRLEWFNAHEFDVTSIRTVPEIPTLRAFRIPGTLGVFTLDDIKSTRITELDVSSSTGFSTVSGIGKFSRLRWLDLRGSSVPASELSTELTKVAATLEELRIGPISNFSFLGSYPSLVFFGVEINGTLFGTIMTEISSYGPFRGLGFYGVTSFDALSNLSGSGISELELHFSGTPTLTGTQLSLLALRRLNVYGASTFTLMSDLPTTIENLEIRSTLLSDTEVAGIASTLFNLRRLDLSDDDPGTTPNPSYSTLLPLSTNAGTMQNLEEVIVRNVPLDSSGTVNGIPELAVLPNLRLLDVTRDESVFGPWDTTTSGINDLINATNEQVSVEY
ncbi:MAG: hypothetical protein ACOCYQ_03175 [Alkalispirochaeta sp.]